jgi:hypothetical protein
MNVSNSPQYIAIILRSEGLWDCLFVIPLIKKLRSLIGADNKFAVFTVHPRLFENCLFHEGLICIPIVEQIMNVVNRNSPLSQSSRRTTSEH